MADEVQQLLHEKDNVNSVISQVNISEVESGIRQQSYWAR